MLLEEAVQPGIVLSDRIVFAGAAIPAILFPIAACLFH